MAGGLQLVTMHHVKRCTSGALWSLSLHPTLTTLLCNLDHMYYTTLDSLCRVTDRVGATSAIPACLLAYVCNRVPDYREAKSHTIITMWRWDSHPCVLLVVLLVTHTLYIHSSTAAFYGRLHIGWGKPWPFVPSLCRQPPDTSRCSHCSESA